jgi:formylglycine-generating enzyme required for sulfatase activity
VPNSSANPNLGTEFEEMVHVVGGVFEMGCKSGRDDISVSCNSWLMPSHYAQVNNFYIGKYEVTQALWKKVMGSNPSTYTGDNKPVTDVSYDDITGSGGFLEKLNAQTGKSYRLPTEAEWEYAARGCSSGNCESFEYSGSNTIGEVAYYNVSGGPTTVGAKRPNALGLYDMSGNVWEWCSDWWSESFDFSAYTASNPRSNPTGPTEGAYRVNRGGSWNSDASYGLSYCRATYRSDYSPSGRISVLGFRLV